jgi:putative colanic acid biosynthesis acetyltransferase WcaF
MEPQLTVRLDRYSNAAHDRGPLLRRIAWTLVSRAFFATPLPYPSGLKRALLRSFGASIGRGVVLKPRLTIKYPWKLEIGDHAWIGEGVWIDNLVAVAIGPHCCISQGAMLLCGNHDYRSTTFDLLQGEVVLEAGVWIGARAVVGPESTCESHSVLALGSVARGRLKAWTVYRGNPAVPVRDRTMRDLP